MTREIVVKGSIQDVAKTGDVALALMDAKVVLLCDRSGSMSEEAHGRKARFEIEDEVVTKLQARYPGQVALIAFSDVAYICPDGVLPSPSGNTNMLDAFRKAQPLAEAGLRVILISDGEPSHAEPEVIAEARKFRGQMDTIFVGPEQSPGADFMRRLAGEVGGDNSVCDLKKDAGLLENKLNQLMLTAGNK